MNGARSEGAGSNAARPTGNPFAALKDKLGALPQGPAPAATPSEAPTRVYAGRVSVRRERAGRGGKAVTVAEGPGLSGQPLEKLAKELAKALGTGARVESTTLVVQGDQPERVVAWLRDRGFAQVARGN